VQPIKTDNETHKTK